MTRVKQMIELKHGDCIEMMRTIPDASVHCCVTSPPYWGLRDYGHDGQIGLESTPEAYVARMVEVFREVRRVLREDGTLWLNLGDSYAGGGGFAPDAPCNVSRREMIAGGDRKHGAFNLSQRQHTRNKSGGIKPQCAIKAKDLVGIPWRVAFALQADGWWLRQDIIWHKPNPMPESVRDRCTKAHEYVFLLTKSERYYYDADAIKQEAKSNSEGIRFGGSKYGDNSDPKHATKSGNVSKEYAVANRRSVWTIATKPYSGAHFAVMPTDLVEPCIRAGSPEGGIVLDPFAGSGTVLAVAVEWGRKGIGCELNGEYINLAKQRIAAARAKCALFQLEETAFVNSGDDQ